MYKIGKSLTAAGCSVRLAMNESEKDLGDMLKSEVCSIMNSAQPYNEYNGIKHKIEFLRSGSIF